jgi:hypothetical protein
MRANSQSHQLPTVQGLQNTIGLTYLLEFSLFVYVVLLDVLFEIFTIFQPHFAPAFILFFVLVRVFSLNCIVSYA